MPLLARLSSAWIAGIALAHWLNLPWPVVAIAVVPAVSALVLYRGVPRGRTAAILTLALLAGAFRLTFFRPVFNEAH